MSPTDERQRSENQDRGQKRATGLATKAGSVALWLCVWQIASMAIGSRLLLAGPLDTLIRLSELIVSQTFLETVWFSTARILSGFAVAYVVGVMLAMLSHLWPTLEELLAPAIATLKSVPVACVVVLLLIWVGSRKVSAIVVFLAVFPAVYFACAEGLRYVDARVSKMLEVFGVIPPVRFLAHVWPQVLPYLVGTSRNVCGMAWKAGIAAELIGSPRGSIGERVYQAKVLLETADLFAWTIVVVVISALFERAFVWLLANSDRLTRTAALILALARHTERDVVPQDINLTGVSIGYPGKVVREGITLSVPAGTSVVLTDVSGSGKTTLLLSVAGILTVVSGKASLPHDVTMVFQEPRLIEGMTAVENVMLTAGAAVNEDEVREALLELLPLESVDVPVSQLSGGQRRRTEIVRALVCAGQAVLLDEPFASLDERTHHEAAAFVKRWLDGRTLLVASHLPDDAALLGASELRLF